jgi:DnaJ-class molecular chaperone
MLNAANSTGCPHCNGTGTDLRRQLPQGMAHPTTDPMRPGERDGGFPVAKCPRCHGSGRVESL